MFPSGAVRSRLHATIRTESWDMSEKFSIWREIFGRDRKQQTTVANQPKEGDIFYYRPDMGPVEYAQVIGVYTEAADIRHVRFRLVYGYKEKHEDLGEKTLAAALFCKRFQNRLNAPETQPD
jgi:hypothetical protein